MSKKIKNKSRFFKRRTAPGTLPGALIVDPEALMSTIEVVRYNETYFWETQGTSSELVKELKAEAGSITWINIEGLKNIELIKELGQRFHLHPLSLEDAVSVHQRPKLDTYPSYLFLVARMPHPDESIETEQVSFFMGDNFLLTFQEGYPGDCFDPIRERLRHNLGQMRSAGADFLLYSLLDTLIDHYFPVLEKYGEKLEDIEEAIITNPYPALVSEIYALKRRMLMIRRAIWPLRDVVNTLIRDTNAYICPETKVYLRDCYDHIVQLVDLIETYRDLGSNLMDVYLSSTGNRMNEIMKFLTMMSAIFIPLTFIAGVYGMNFKTETSPLNMPELKWYYGYPLCLLLMTVIALALLFIFRSWGWLGIPVKLNEPQIGPTQPQDP